VIPRFNPTQLQGNLNKINYFEGWFQKVYSPQLNTTFIVIYGFATGDERKEIGFIQLCVPNQKIILLTFDKNEVVCHKKKHHVRFGNHVLSEKEIKIQTDEILIDLVISHKQERNKVKNSMGNFYLVPNLPCYHAIVNDNQLINGTIQFQNEHYHLMNASGYLEKNWGKSFPEKYIWLHAFDPGNFENQLLFSKADIRWSGNTFTKHLGFIRINGEYFDLRKLKNCKITISKPDPTNQLIVIRSTTLDIELNVNFNKKVVFKGPENGQLNRPIEHFNDVSIEVKTSHKSKKNTLLLTGNFENINY